MQSNLHYNYYRTYNPLIGRYIQSDPIDLAAGFNTYNYVEGNPLGATDSLELIEDSILVNTIVAWGDIMTLGTGNIIRNKFNIKNDYYEKKHFSKPTESEINCFIENEKINKTGFYRDNPKYKYNTSYAIAEHYDFSKFQNEYLGPIGAIMSVITIPGYTLYKNAFPFFQSDDTSPTSIMDFKYSVRGVKDGLSIFFSKNNPYIK